MILKMNFSVTVMRPMARVSEFTVTHLGIPLLIRETKQGYRTGEAAQTRFTRTAHAHTQST